MKRLTFLLVLSLGVFGLFARGGGEVVAGSASQRGEIIYLEGEVSLDGVNGEIGAEVPVGAVVATGADSYCEIVFGGQNIFRVEAETTAKLSIAEGGIALQSGSLSLILDKLEVLGEGAEFQVSTPVAVAGVRGTSFYVKMESEDSTYFCVCNGALYTEDVKGGNDRVIEALHHNAVRYTKGADGSISASSAKMLYHHDEDYDAMADKIGVKIPWEF